MGAREEEGRAARRAAGRTDRHAATTEGMPSHTAQRSGPGFVLSFLLIENLLQKLQLYSLMSQEMVNVHFSKIWKAAKKEGQEEKGKIFGMMCFFVLLCPECGRAVCQPPASRAPRAPVRSLPRRSGSLQGQRGPLVGHGGRTGTCSQAVTSVSPTSPPASST